MHSYIRFICLTEIYSYFSFLFFSFLFFFFFLQFQQNQNEQKKSPQILYLLSRILANKKRAKKKTPSLIINSINLHWMKRMQKKKICKNCKKLLHISALCVDNHKNILKKRHLVWNFFLFFCLFPPCPFRFSFFLFFNFYFLHS